MTLNAQDISQPNSRPQPQSSPSTPAESKASRQSARTAKTTHQSIHHTNHDLLHYAAYFLGVGGLVFVTQSGQPAQLKQSVIAGAIASGAVVSRDWFKARLDPNMANDPSALISLFNEMLHAGRAQVNVNAAHLKRVEFLQVDLKDALVSFNDLLRLEPDAIAERLQAAQSIRFAQALPTPLPPPIPMTAPTANQISETHVPPATTVQQSFSATRPGFDA